MGIGWVWNPAAASSTTEAEHGTTLPEKDCAAWSQHAAQRLPWNSSLWDSTCTKVATSVGLGSLAREEPPDCPGERQEVCVFLLHHYLFANSSSRWSLQNQRKERWPTSAKAGACQEEKWRMATCRTSDWSLLLVKQMLWAHLICCEPHTSL